MVEEGKKKGGRPLRVLDEKEIAQVEALAAFLTTEQIADFLGISQNTFLAICERQNEVSAVYKKGRAKAIANVAKNLLVQATQENNLGAMIFYLKTQGGWRETQTVDNISSDGSMTPKTITRVIIDPKKQE